MVFLRLLAIVLTALLLVPNAAVLVEFPLRMGLERDAYFAVQGVQRAWPLLAIPYGLAILSCLSLAVGERRRNPVPARMALFATAVTGLALAVSFIAIRPVHEATAGWTMQPENWQGLRMRWEYGHALNAILMGMAFLSVTLAGVMARPHRF